MKNSIRRVRHIQDPSPSVQDDELPSFWSRFIGWRIQLVLYWRLPSFYKCFPKINYSWNDKISFRLKKFFLHIFLQKKSKKLAINVDFECNIPINNMCKLFVWKIKKQNKRKMTFYLCLNSLIRCSRLKDFLV